MTEAKSSSIAWLVALRILFGATMTVSALRFLAYGWVDELWLKPQFHFSYLHAEWARVPPPWAMHSIFVALFVLAVAMTVGAWFRVTAFAFAALLAYVQLLDVATYLNHYYLACLLALLLALSPAGSAFSIDAWRKGRQAHAIARGWHLLFRVQVGIVYTCAGLAKANADWLLHAQPLRIWLASKTDLPVLGALFTIEGVPLAMSWAGFFFDSTIVWFLLWRRTRALAYVVVIAFHAMTRMLFPIGMFPFIMIVAATVFFDPAWPLRFVSWPRQRAQRIAMARASVWPIGLGVRVLMVSFLVLQIALPLRWLAYGGNVLWHEQGLRFSWRVMAREKNGTVTFVVRNVATGAVRHVAPSAYLTPLQEREMCTQPDLVLQLAHRIARDSDARGVRVEVFADTAASLNGRPAVALVDPNVDLARIADGLEPASWIAPAPRVAPPHTRAVPSRGREVSLR